MWIWVIASYFIAGINGAYITTKWLIHQDIRTVGSGTSGARNSGRAAGKKAFIGTVVIDALKTVVPLMAALHYGWPDGILGLIVIVLIIGHIWSIWLKGQGGKGVVVYLASVLILETTGLMLIGGTALLAKYIPVSFSRAMLVAMAAPPVLSFVQGELIIGVSFGIGYLVVISAHLLPVHPRFTPKEEHK